MAVSHVSRMAVVVKKILAEVLEVEGAWWVVPAQALDTWPIRVVDQSDPPLKETCTKTEGR